MAWADQVLRLNEFKKRWPVVTICPPASYNGRWVAEWPEENGSSTVTRYELGELLDVLQERFEPPKGPAWQREVQH